MSVTGQNGSQFDQDIQSILDEIENIDEQQSTREQIYTKCLNKYKNHLNFEIDQFSKTEKQFDNRNNRIKESYKHLYESINENIDVSLRSIKRTYQNKKSFWTQIIKQFQDSSNIQQKKKLYYLKRQSQDKIYEAIDERKAYKKLSFDLLISTKIEDENKLLTYQNNVKIFEGKVYSGTNTMAKWKALNAYENTIINKQNTDQNNLSSRVIQNHKRREDHSDHTILHNFMKK